MSRRIGLVWAEAADRIIGSEGTLPWRLPEDLQRFKELTMGATVVMGRVTWESLPVKFRPLPGRRNIVVTRQPGYAAPGAETASSLRQALDMAEGDVWIAGGAALYEAGMEYADRIIRTRIHLTVDGDTRAPEVGADWRMVGRDPETGLHRSADGVEYCIATFERGG